MSNRSDLERLRANLAKQRELLAQLQAKQEEQIKSTFESEEDYKKDYERRMANRKKTKAEIWKKVLG